MDRLAELRSLEQDVREESYRTFSSEVDVLEYTLGFTHAVIGSVDAVELDHTFLRLLLVSRAAGSLRCAWLSGAAGYRTQALTLARAAFEDYATAQWLSKHPEDAELWLWEIADDLPAPSRRPPRFASIFEQLGQDDPRISETLERVYGHLSEAAHPRAPGLQWNVQWGPGADGAQHSADLSPVFDESATASCLHHILAIAGLILAVAAELYLASQGTTMSDGEDFIAALKGQQIRQHEAHERLIPLMPTDTRKDPA